MVNTALIEEQFLKAQAARGDISEHLERLRELAAECEHVVEGGVRYVVSTWAFLLGCACRGGSVVSYCWNTLPEIERALEVCAAAGVCWDFRPGDWLKATIPETDLLFIDTRHTYQQLKAELALHATRARKYLVFHDTETFGDQGEDGSRPGLQRAIDEWMAVEPWRIKERYTHCNGLTICERN